MIAEWRRFRNESNIGLNIKKSAEITQNGTRKKHFIACRENIRCLWGRLFVKIVLHFSSEAHKTGSNENRKIYRYPSERERLDAGEARRKARCDQQDHFLLRVVSVCVFAQIGTFLFSQISPRIYRVEINIFYSR